MYGYGSTLGNGARKPLRDALRFDGWSVNMVRTQTSGNMVDWNSEATPGFVITQMQAAFQKSKGYKANVVIINCGTNDANGPVDPPNAGNRMRAALNDIWAADGMANTCIMLSTVIPTRIANGIAYRPTINEQYRQLVSQFANSGRCIHLADMDPPAPHPAHGWIDANNDINADGIHPNDNGHNKMAYVFYKAINQAYNDNRIVAAVPMNTAGTTGCRRVYGSGIDPGYNTQVNSGQDDGLYRHEAEAPRIVFSRDSPWDRNQWRFGRLFSRNYDDLLAWIDNYPNPGQNSYVLWKNSADGKGQFTNIDTIHVEMYCNPSEIHLVDMNADGLDDIVYVSSIGNLYLVLNNGDGHGNTPPTFKSMGLVKRNEGRGQLQVLLGAIDGDGRCDYCVTDTAGPGANVYCWRNGGTGPVPEYWQALGLRFRTGLSPVNGDGQGYRFEDINGDGRDDMICMDLQGTAWLWTNTYSCAPGKEGDGLHIAWMAGSQKAATSGPAMFLNVPLQNPELDLRNRIHFARVFGEPQEFGLLGRQDYVYMKHTHQPDGSHFFEMYVSKNSKSWGATKVFADGDKYCNMMGHANGAMDYVWTLSKGSMTLYPNAGRGMQVGSGQSYWLDSPGIIWQPTKFTDRKDLHLADWNGDGVCC